MFQGFSHFSGFLHHFVLARLAPSSIRVDVIKNIRVSLPPGVCFECYGARREGEAGHGVIDGHGDEILSIVLEVIVDGRLKR